MMQVKSTSSPFGTETRTRVLAVLYLLGQSYPRELARLLDARLSSVQRALATLEADGLVAARTLGRTRVCELNPRYFAVDALRAYLGRLADAEAELRARVASLRRRPRRTGKPP